MSWALAAGVLGSGLLGAKSSKDAAEAGQKGAERASGISQAAAQQARQDVLTMFPSAQKDLLAGYSGAYDLLGQGIGEQQRLLQEGNLAAQGTTAGGFDQVRAALMGLPVDTQGFAPQGIQASQVPANPMMGLGGQAPMFSNIKEVREQVPIQALSGVENNRQLLNRVASGELPLQGVDTSFWRAVLDDPNRAKDDPFLSSNSIFGATTPQQQARMVAGSGFNTGNQEKFAQLLSEVQRIRGLS